ncbi:unannotated protein [freshwater metagenome]
MDVTTDALIAHSAMVSAEVLATSWQQGTVSNATALDDELGLKVLIIKA